MIRRNTVLKQIKEKITEEEKEVYDELTERLKRYYEDDSIMNKSQIKSIYDYAYVKKEV